MPWTAKQTRYMYANHPEIAKRVTNEPGFYIKDKAKSNARKRRKGRRK